MCCDSGGSSAPPPPDYSALSAASVDAAKMQQQTAKDQLSWAKDQWSQQWPITQQYMQSMTDSTNQQMGNAQKDRARYEGTFQPLEDQLVRTAQGWNSPDRAAQESGAAMGDVATAFDAQRKSALSTLESYGIDPSQTRFGALDLGTRVSQAAATAAAGTQSRKNTEATGLSLLGESINIGKGYPGQVAQSYSGATSAGSAGVGAGNNTFGTYSGQMGGAATWSGLGSQSLGTAGNTMNQGYQNALNYGKANDAVSASNSQGMGNLVGGALAIGAMAMM